MGWVCCWFTKCLNCYRAVLNLVSKVIAYRQLLAFGLRLAEKSNWEVVGLVLLL